jgi:hypothetical protein
MLVRTDNRTPIFILFLRIKIFFAIFQGAVYFLSLKKGYKSMLSKLMPYLPL